MASSFCDCLLTRKAGGWWYLVNSPTPEHTRSSLFLLDGERSSVFSTTGQRNLPKAHLRLPTILSSKCFSRDNLWLLKENLSPAPYQRRQLCPFPISFFRTIFKQWQMKISLSKPCKVKPCLEKKSQNKTFHPLNVEHLNPFYCPAERCLHYNQGQLLQHSEVNKWMC